MLKPKPGDLVRILVSTLLHKKNSIGLVVAVRRESDYKLNPVATVVLGGEKIRITPRWLEVVSEAR